MVYARLWQVSLRRDESDKIVLCTIWAVIRVVEPLDGCAHELGRMAALPENESRRGGGGFPPRQYITVRTGWMYREMERSVMPSSSASLVKIGRKWYDQYLFEAVSHSLSAPLPRLGLDDGRFVRG